MEYVFTETDYILLVKNLELLEICLADNKFYIGSADENFLNHIKEIVRNDVNKRGV